MPTLKSVTHNITSIDNVQSIRLTEAFNTPVSQVVIEGDETTLGLGDSFQFNMGYVGDTGKVFEGFVREISRDTTQNTVTVIAEDVLARAVDFYMAATDPENPFSRSNISTENLVSDILAEAGITSVNSNLPLSVTWGTNGPMEINLITAWAAAKSIADMMAWHIYADRNGTVQFLDRKPYVMTGDTTDYTWVVGTDNIVTIDYAKSAENLRNKVVVYGKDNISASASASSPHLPSGFFKTAVIATPFLDTVANCQKAADFNLELFNRLTERITLSIEGDFNVTAREIADVTDTYTGVSGDWFIYRVESVISSRGFIQNVVLTR